MDHPPVLPFPSHVPPKPPGTLYHRNHGSVSGNGVWLVGGSARETDRRGGRCGGARAAFPRAGGLGVGVTLLPEWPGASPATAPLPARPSRPAACRYIPLMRRTPVHWLHFRTLMVIFPVWSVALIHSKPLAPFDLRSLECSDGDGDPDPAALIRAMNALQKQRIFRRTKSPFRHAGEGCPLLGLPGAIGADVMMDETEREWYFERNREESAYWQKSLALQTELVEAQKKSLTKCARCMA